MEKLTIKKIATLANVSIATVDRYLHNRGYVKHETRKKLEEICTQHNYKQNYIGKAMVMQKKETKIAVVCGDPDASIFSLEIYEGLKKSNKKWEDLNVSFIYYFLKYNSLKEIFDILEEVSKKDYSGLIIKPLNNNKVAEKINKYFSNIPIVTSAVDLSNIESKICFVGHNHFNAGQLASSVLCKIVKDDIKMVLISDPLEMSSRGEKLNGFLSYIKDKNKTIEISKQIIIEDNSPFDENTLANLLKNSPDANVIYLSSFNALTLLYKIGRKYSLNKTTIAFGSKTTLHKLIRDDIVDYAICDNPSEIGYMSGEAMMRHIVHNRTYENKWIETKETLVFDANC